jgi:hypothetical protein
MHELHPIHVYHPYSTVDSFLEGHPIKNRYPEVSTYLKYIASSICFSPTFSISLLGWAACGVLLPATQETQPPKQVR